MTASPSQTARVLPRMSFAEAWYWRLCGRITPGLVNAQYRYFETLKRTLEPGDRWLDLGCGRRIAPAWMRNAAQVEHELIAQAGEVVGIDPDVDALAENSLDMVKHLCDARSVPEPDAAFDLVTANMVAEHLDDPEAVLREVYRLLKPGGRLLFHTPNVLYPVTLAAALVPSGLRRRLTAWLEKRPAKDIYPTRYRLNQVRTIYRLAHAAGLQVVTIQREADSPETVRLGPLVALELIWIALTRTRMMKGLRSNLIVTLRKPDMATRLPLTSQNSQQSPRKAA